MGSKRIYVFAAFGLLAIVYGISGLKGSSAPGILSLFGKELSAVNKKYEAQAGIITGATAGTSLDIENSGKPEFTVRYSYYRNCLESSKPCEGFPSQDGDLYLSEVRNQMLSEMTALYEHISQSPAQLTPDHEKTAQLMLTDATPDMQVIGFQMLDMFPVSEINLDLIAQTTEDAFDDGVVNAGLHTLERYKNTPAYQNRITAALIQQIGLGVNDQAAVQAIEKLPVFLTPENKKQFQDLLTQLQEASRQSSGLQRRYKTLERVLK